MDSAKKAKSVVVTTTITQDEVHFQVVVRIYKGGPVVSERTVFNQSIKMQPPNSKEFTEVQRGQQYAAWNEAYDDWQEE